MKLVDMQWNNGCEMACNYYKIQWQGCAHLEYLSQELTLTCSRTGENVKRGTACVTVVAT